MSPSSSIIYPTEIESLRQQLSEVSFRNERLVADYAELERQRAELEKQNEELMIELCRRSTK